MGSESVFNMNATLKATRELLVTDLVILNHGHVTRAASFSNFYTTQTRGIGASVPQHGESSVLEHASRQRWPRVRDHDHSANAATKRHVEY
ncbi:hypothetical protein TNCV_3547581 [Trichonephila clavipes]|nr:hypothetical protein TNCV_3547581 [Trichonephila clavipes]